MVAMCFAGSKGFDKFWPSPYADNKKGLEFLPGSPEHKEWYANIQKRFKIK